jgi:hypothetical protein
MNFVEPFHLSASKLTSLVTLAQLLQPRIAQLGEHCGGFIRNAPVCDKGLVCSLKGKLPVDVGGTCIQSETPATSTVKI